jgi:hypothetical protein
MSTTVQRRGRRGGQPGGHDHTDPAHSLPGLVDAAPTHQFVHALAAIGWSLKEQGRRLGLVDGATFRRILGQARVQRATAVRVAALYARLWDVPGPCPRTVAWAARQGWEAADPVVVSRLVAGTTCPHTTADRDQAMRVLAAHGRSVYGIASQFATSHHTVRAITGATTRAAA